MKFVWAALYTGFFLATFIAASIAISLTGVGVPIARSLINVRTATYYEAYRTLTNVNSVLGLSLAILLTVALWSIRNPGKLRLKFDRFVRRAENASGLALVVYWLVAVFTIVGYPLAIYASWHFAKRRLGRSAVSATPEDLASRLERLDSARDAGLITQQEHAAKRAEVIQAW
jgi:hypothetical protein